MSYSYSGSCISSGARQRGVALALVVWFVAGMSLLVAGIVAQARVDIKLTQLHVARAKVVAAGDGAIQLKLAEVMTSQNNKRATEGVYQLGEIEVDVSLLPASALVNLNTAPLDILASLFAVGAGINPGQARSIAVDVIKWRSASNITRGEAKRRSGFDAIEDILKVEGVNRTMLDSIRDYVVAGAAARDDMDLSQASGQLLGALEQTNPARAKVAKDSGLLSGIGGASGRDDAGSGQQGSASGVYRADALIQYNGRTWLRRRWVAMEWGPSSSLPWRFLRTEPPRVYEG